MRSAVTQPTPVKAIRYTDQIGHARIARRAVNMRRGALLQYLAGVHHHQLVRQLSGFVQVVRHQHDRNMQIAAQVGDQTVQTATAHLVHR